MVAWSPIPYNWNMWKKIIRTLKRTNYPQAGDTLQCISVGENISFILRQMIPTPFRAQDSRHLWNVMQSRGWELVAQGETHSRVINT